MVQRAYNAHCEAFIAFSAAILLSIATSNLGGEIDRLANAFVVVRIAYNLVYIAAYNKPLSVIRSAVWTFGIIIIFKIFYIGGADVSSVFSKLI